ncbi:glycosyltransferase [Virgibacillus sp. FSP13]
MKVCFLAAASSIHTVRWVNAIVERGHDVDLITMHHSKSDRIDSRVCLHQLKVPAPIGYYLNGLEVKMLIRGIQPDILHVHYASGYGTLARLIDFNPSLLSVWGSDVYLFPDKSKRNEKTLKKNLNAVTQITSTSYAMKEQTEQFVTPKSPIEVIPFGIDLDLFKASGTKDSNSIVIGTVKKLEQIYGIDILIIATAKLVDYLRSTNYEDIVKRLKLMIVGDGSQLTYLQELARKLHISEITEFVAAVPNNQVPHYLNQLDIYCAFSRSESFGVAVLEASACEVPVVVSHVGGLPEVAKDGQTGYMVDYENIDDIVNRLFELVIDKDKRNHFGKNGRDFVKNNYNWYRNVSHMEEIYLGLK